MAKQVINIGTVANDGTGDPIRTSFNKTNGNFDELYATKLPNTIYVGAGMQFTTVKAAVDWFNTSATGHTKLIIDAGDHSISDTILVNNSSYGLQIVGSGFDITYLNAATGLANKPMFEVRTEFSMYSLELNGSTLASYGTQTGENGISFTTNTSTYSELKDIVFNTFKIGVADLIGCGIFIFDFVIENCGIGYQVNHSGAGTSTTDIEVGNFVNCPIGIDLLKAGGDSFVLYNLLFLNPVNGIRIKYTGGAGNYVYGSPSNIMNCSYNDVGTLFSGFDFTLQRDANIVLINNVGEEDKNPHAKINVTDNVTTTTVTTAGTYYKVGFTNSMTYTCKMGIANGQMTYWPKNKKDGIIWITGNAQVGTNGKNVNFTIRRNLSITSVTGNGATVTVTTTIPHHLSTGNLVQMLSWTGGTGTWNGVYTITVTGTNTFTYIANGNGTATGGTSGALLAPITVRMVTGNVLYPFTLLVYIDGVQQNEYFDLYVTSSSNGDVITMSDLQWLFNAR